jgi:suppressor of G2 allele of SKP1
MAAASTSNLRHEFYQTDANVVVSVFVKNVKTADLTSDIQPRSVRFASVP